MGEVDMRKTLVVVALALAFATSGAWAVDFSSGWFVDWGLEVLLQNDWAAPADGGTHLTFDKTGNGGSGAVAPGSGAYNVTGVGNVYYTLEDYIQSDSSPFGGELFDVEALLTTADANWNYFLLVTSFGDQLLAGKVGATVGDLAINPDSETWNDAGGNTSEFGVKLGGGQAGWGEENPEWGYYWDMSDRLTTDYRNPMYTDSANDPNPNGKLPSEAHNWGGNFWWGSGGTQYDPGDATPKVKYKAQTIFANGDAPPGSSLETWAFGVAVHKDLVPSVSTVKYAPSCLNDSTTTKTPEPTTAALLVAGVGGLILRRRRKTS
jgi:hypothetical protein